MPGDSSIIIGEDQPFNLVNGCALLLNRLLGLLLKLLESLPGYFLLCGRRLNILDHSIARPPGLILDDDALANARPSQELLHGSTELIESDFLHAHAVVLSGISPLPW